MKNFVVVLSINILGEYEKKSTNLVCAENDQEARQFALEGECHGSPDWSEDDGSKRICSDLDVMYYCVQSTTEVTDDEFKTLSEYVR